MCGYKKRCYSEILAAQRNVEVNYHRMDSLISLSMDDLRSLSAFWLHDLSQEPDIMSGSDNCDIINSLNHCSVFFPLYRSRSRNSFVTYVCNRLLVQGGLLYLLGVFITSQSSIPNAIRQTCAFE